MSVDYKTAIIFFSDKLKTNLPQIRSIQFDGTFQTVPVWDDILYQASGPKLRVVGPPPDPFRGPLHRTPAK